MSQLKPGDIEEIIRQFEASGRATLECRVGETELFLSRDPGARPSWADQGAPPAPSAAPAPPPSAAADAAADAPAALEIPAGHVAVTAPSMGTFYRAEKPGAAPYVEVDQEVAPETELGLIEVMKLFTTVRAGVRGQVAQILVADATPIALDQPLFLLKVHE